jgi:hypothetical protein
MNDYQAHNDEMIGYPVPGPKPKRNYNMLLWPSSGTQCARATRVKLKLAGTVFFLIKRLMYKKK